MHDQRCKDQAWKHKQAGWDRLALGMQGEGGGRCTLWDKQREYFVSKRISSEIVNHHFYISQYILFPCDNELPTVLVAVAVLL